MRSLLALLLFTGLWPTLADAKAARSCSTKFKSHKVFNGHKPVRAQELKKTLVGACEVGLSDSQIAGKVLKSCIRSCDRAEEVDFDTLEAQLFNEERSTASTTVSPKHAGQCKQSCFGTIQKMAKENLRLKKYNWKQR